MDDEIEDIVGDVKYSDSQKSIATRSSLALYPSDFADAEASSRCSEINQSTGKETYVIECDSDDSDKLVYDKRVFEEPASPYRSVMCGTSENIFTKCASTSYHTLSAVTQEIHTQTSKTVIELAETDFINGIRIVDRHNLHTQTSYMSMMEKTVEYSIQVHDFKQITGGKMDNYKQPQVSLEDVTENQYAPSCISDNSSKLPVGELASECSTGEEIIKIVDEEGQLDSSGADEDNRNSYNAQELGSEHINEYEEDFHSDMEDDSLMEDTFKNTDVDELHTKIYENIDLCFDRYADPDIRRFGTLTPLAEETSKKESLLDLNPSKKNIAEGDHNQDELVFTNDTGMNVKVLRNDVKNAQLKLPPIQSCPNSPHLMSSWLGPTNLSKAGTLPSLVERRNNRWEIETKNLAAGESNFISRRSDSPKSLGAIQLPPINCDTQMTNRSMLSEPTKTPTTIPYTDVTSSSQEPICIKDKIKELKLYPSPLLKERCFSPGSSMSPDRRDIAQLGCEAVVVELLKKLHSTSWFEVVDTLAEMPNDLERFWGIISEMRIADLIRQVNVHVESPRPQVARMACGTVAAILKNTNYTKKPDFYETVTLLLTKTGSYSRLVRRAANVALDHIVCGVDLTHAVTALSIHGIGHKNALVRCASARLLVVCCALAGGGRRLLRGRPPTAATARRLALRALSAFLDDRSSDTRKYAERLYAMLRPLSNFEAYYLTDVEVDIASRQMKKYDQLLYCTQTKETR